MPQLFVLPKQVPLTSAAGLIPGAKLYFTQTGTTTPQNTYQDIDLTTPHANPVVADANGVFPPIYLEPTLPDYRIKLTTAADVLVYQEDDIPSGQTSSQRYRLASTVPELIFEETDASPNNKLWRIRVNSEQLTVDIGNDAESVWTNVLSIDRTGTTLDSLQKAGSDIAVQTSDTYTGTLTGCTTSPTGTINYKRVGDLVTLYVNSQLIGTSNSTAKTITGMPAGIRPTNSKFGYCPVIDDDVSTGGTFTVGSNGTITLNRGHEPPTVFDSTPTSGGSGIPASWQITYVID